MAGSPTSTARATFPSLPSSDAPETIALVGVEIVKSMDPLAANHIAAAGREGRRVCSTAFLPNACRIVAPIGVPVVALPPWHSNRRLPIFKVALVLEAQKVFLGVTVLVACVLARKIVLVTVDDAAMFPLSRPLELLLRELAEMDGLRLYTTDDQFPLKAHDQVYRLKSSSHFFMSSASCAFWKSQQ